MSGPADAAPPGASAAAEELPFEEAVERLEGLVARLESGELALEEALAAFEEGVALSRRCAAQLEAAERRIEALVQDGEGWSERALEGAEEDEPLAPPEGGGR